MNYKILDQHGLNFLTMTLVDWIDLFTRQVYCDIIIESLSYCQKEKGLNVHAYVIMPSHLHLILQTDNPKGLSYILQCFKSYTAKAILRYLKRYSNVESRRQWLLERFEFNARRNKRDSKYQVWQKGSHPIILYSPKAIRINLNYIHKNPVVAGIVKKQEYFEYSSASNYINGKGVLEVKVLDDIYMDIGYIDLGF